MKCTYCATEYSGLACPHCGAANAFAHTANDWTMHLVSGGSAEENVCMCIIKARELRKRVMFIWRGHTIYEILPSGTFSFLEPPGMRDFWDSSFCSYGYPYSR